MRFTLHSICEPCLAIVRSSPSDRSPCQRCGASLDPPHEADPIAAYPDDPRPHLPADPTLPLCGTCQTSPPPFVRAVSAATYRDQFRQVIHLLKYGRMQPVAGPLGLMLADAIRTLAVEAPRQMLVIPVPLHRRRRRERGFNQARLLAAHALRSLRRTHPDWQLTLSPASLVRQRATTPQVELRPAERRINLERAFHVARPGQVQGRAILLIDDILTTGATARACAQSLLDAGAACVFVATLARAQLTYSNGFWTVSDTDDGLITRELINHELISREPIPTLPYPANNNPSPHPT